MASRNIIFTLISFLLAITICYGAKLDQHIVKKRQHTTTTVVKQHKPTITYYRDAKINNVELENDISVDYIDVPNDHGIEFAGIVMEKSCKTISANIRIDKPAVAVGHRSGAYISIESGADSTFNQIQVGWLVHPDMYGDFEVHMYARWTGDNDTKCFHLQCPGFVTTDRSGLMLGRILTPSAYYTDPINFLRLSLTLDDSGKWFLSGGENDIRPIGFWDVSYFSSLSSEGATITHFGGEVFTPEQSDSSPPMGSGTYINSQYYRTCYIDDIQLDNEEPNGIEPQIYWSRCYVASDPKLRNVPSKHFGIFFGGAGGTKYKCI